MPRCHHLSLSTSVIKPSNNALTHHTTKPQSSCHRTESGRAVAPIDSADSTTAPDEQISAQNRQLNSSEGLPTPQAQDNLILDDEDDKTSLKDIVAVVSVHNDSHVLAQIIEEYEMRLKEQVTMAKEDIVQALEEQIQVRCGLRANILLCAFSCLHCIGVWSYTSINN